VSMSLPGPSRRLPHRTKWEAIEGKADTLPTTLIRR
jgi:hypothetical protein